MKIFVQSMILRGFAQVPEQHEMSLHEFFVQKAHDYQENPRFPFDREGREGGCQFAFDRDPGAAMRCRDCESPVCRCSPAENRPRYFLQKFTATRICILDIDLNDSLAQAIRPGWEQKHWCKYHALLWDEEQKLREMERKLMDLPGICFFYRTKCNGFRIAFEAKESMDDLSKYESEHNDRLKLVEECYPDYGSGTSKWFHHDPVGSKGQSYWSYPRVHNPIWLNPKCNET